jgi:DNA-binding PadR family transcriptional regulator
MPRDPVEPREAVDAAEGALPLSEPVYHILLALADEPRHGYGIIQAVERWTEGRVRLRTGTLYTALRRLEEDGVVAEPADRPAPEEDGRRRYYTLTPHGRAVLRAEAGRLERLVALARGHRVLPRSAS